MRQRVFEQGTATKTRAGGRQQSDRNVGTLFLLAEGDELGGRLVVGAGALGQRQQELAQLPAAPPRAVPVTERSQSANWFAHSYSICIDLCSVVT